MKTEAWARRRDPRTSHEAAESIRLTHMERKVCECYKASYPLALTSGEVANRLGWERDSVSPRIRPLVRKGLLEDSGRRKVAPSGRRRIAWKFKK